MGRARRRPERLAEKLLRTRQELGLSQRQMWTYLGIEDPVSYTAISKCELGVSEPPLQILLQYARAARLNLEVFVDDALDMPERLPGKTNHEEIRRKYSKPGSDAQVRRRGGPHLKQRHASDPHDVASNWQARQLHRYAAFED